MFILKYTQIKDYNNEIDVFSILLICFLSTVYIYEFNHSWPNIFVSPDWYSRYTSTLSPIFNGQVSAYFEPHKWGCGIFIPSATTINLKIWVFQYCKRANQISYSLASYVNMKYPFFLYQFFWHEQKIIKIQAKSIKK